MTLRSSLGDAGNDGVVSMPAVVTGTHVYLTQDLVEQLFCDRYRLHGQWPLSQNDQYVARESVNLVGREGRLDQVRVIGPPRSRSRVELSIADARLLGVEAPIRDSGDIDGTPGILIEGPRTSVRIDCGVITARRHIYIDPVVAERLGCRDCDCVDVTKKSADGHLLFRGVVVRIASHYRPELHLNSDDAKAAGICAGEIVIIKKQPQHSVPH